MKNKIAISIVSLMLLSAVSCKKYLDIEPKFKFSDVAALSSLDGLSLTTTGAFHQLQSSNLYAGGIVGNTELIADFVNTDPISDFNLNQFRTRQMNSFNSLSGGLWNDAYRAIYISNVVLENLPKFEGQDPALESRLKGECHFIRGIMLFELVRIFAQPSGYTADDSHPGVPIVLSPGTVTTGQNTPRSTVAQVYDQIVSDLKEAEQLLPSTPNARASKYAAQGFLTRVYFTTNKYQEAKDYADKVLAGGFALNDSLIKIYNLSGSAYSSENVFQLIVNPTDNVSGVLFGRFRSIPFAPAQCRMSNALIPYLRADSASGGYRFNQLYKRQKPNFSSNFFNYYVRKYENFNVNMSVIRLAEIILDRAECNAQLGADDATVRADYNLIRVRGGLLPDNSTSGKAALLSAIRAERDLELAMEGDRLFELKRRKQDFTAPDGTFIKWNDDRIVYPIPQQEVENNSNMVQNPGY